MFSPCPSFHKDNGPVSSGIPNLSKSTSNNTAANSVHLYEHLQCPPVSVMQLSKVKKTYLYSGTSWGNAKWNNSFLLLLLASYLNFRTQFMEAGDLLYLKPVIGQAAAEYFQKNSTVIKYLKEQKMCHIKHQP